MRCDTEVIVLAASLPNCYSSTVSCLSVRWQADKPDECILRTYMAKGPCLLVVIPLHASCHPLYCRALAAEVIAERAG